jgi:hypothetical protein
MADNSKQKAPQYNAPSSRVTIAFPFATIKVAETDERISALAALVVELAHRYAELAPSADADNLIERAQAALTAVS